jgi:hypothetical protein
MSDSEHDERDELLGDDSGEPRGMSNRPDMRIKRERPAADLPPNVRTVRAMRNRRRVIE